MYICNKVKNQHAMQVLSDNHGLVDFAIGLMNSVQESTVQIYRSTV